eukprot:scaffold462_cov195-Pinguiococcus_pyrenoidosus.AAC.37
MLVVRREQGVVLVGLRVVLDIADRRLCSPQKARDCHEVLEQQLVRERQPLLGAAHGHHAIRPGEDGVLSAPLNAHLLDGLCGVMEASIVRVVHQLELLLILLLPHDDIPGLLELVAHDGDGHGEVQDAEDHTQHGQEAREQQLRHLVPKAHGRHGDDGEVERMEHVCKGTFRAVEAGL